MLDRLFKIPPSMIDNLEPFSSSFQVPIHPAVRVKKYTKYTKSIFFPYSAIYIHRFSKQLYIRSSFNHQSSIIMAQTTRSQSNPPASLDPASEYRAWQTLQIYFTILLNRQLTRRFQLEQKAMQNIPVTHRFRPLLLLEPIPALTPPPFTTSTNHSQSSITRILCTLAQKVHLLRARVEKGKELASEIERRMENPRIAFPTHFCHTCVVDGEYGGVEVLLTKCGHRVCRTCLGFGVGGHGVYECSICFRPAQLLVRDRERLPLGMVEMGQGGHSGQIGGVSRGFKNGGSGGGRTGMTRPLVSPP